VSREETKPPPAGRRWRRLWLMVLLGALLIGASWVYRAREMPRLVAARRANRLEEELERRRTEAARQATPEAYWSLAEGCLRMGRTDEAISTLRKLVGMDPGHRQARLTLARVLTEHRLFTEGLAANREVIRRWPDDPLGYGGAAVCYRQMNELSRALAVARQAAELKPADPNWQFLLGSIALEHAEQAPVRENAIPHYQVAARALKRAVSANPQNAEAEVRLGRAYSALGLREEAIRCYRRVITASPGSADARGFLAEEQLAANRLDEAEQHARALVAGGSGEERGWVLLGRILVRKGTADAEAEGVLRNALGKAPRNITAWEQLGIVSFRLGKLEEARRAFETAAELDPNRPFPFQQLALVYTRLGDTAKASIAGKNATNLAVNEEKLRYLQSASRRAPQDPRLHLILADRYADLGLNVQARDEYRAALRLQPGMARAVTALRRLETAGAVPP
jgi:Flp pilus assembly protein TadD